MKDRILNFESKEAKVASKIESLLSILVNNETDFLLAHKSKLSKKIIPKKITVSHTSIEVELPEITTFKEMKDYVRLVSEDAFNTLCVCGSCDGDIDTVEKLVPYLKDVEMRERYGIWKGNFAEKFILRASGIIGENWEPLDFA